MKKTTDWGEEEGGRELWRGGEVFNRKENIFSSFKKRLSGEIDRQRKRSKAKEEKKTEG